MRVGSYARTIADAALALLIAPVCAVCREPLDAPSESAVCARCWSSVEYFTPPCCVTCGDALLSWRVVASDDDNCPRCRESRPLVAAAAAIGPYAGALRTIIRALKYDARTSLARPLAARMRLAGAHLLGDAHAVVPVPLHRVRRRQRGFNQADDLARCLSLPVLHALRRAKRTATQADLPAERRHVNVHGAFAMRSGCDVRGLTLVVVDDVSTTGATLDACARPLLDAGAREVRALTAAKTPANRLPPRR
jgi:ComF family protein